MQNDEQVAPRLWYDKNNPELLRAVKKLRRKATCGRVINTIMKPLEKLTGLKMITAIPVILLVNVFSPALVQWFCYLVIIYIVGGSIATWLNKRNASKLQQSIRRGAFGFAVMFDFDAAWKTLATALELFELDIVNLMVNQPDVIRGQIIAYLRSTVVAQRALRTNRSDVMDLELAQNRLTVHANVAATIIANELRPSRVDETSE